MLKIPSYQEQRAREKKRDPNRGISVVSDNELGMFKASVFGVG
jgi:hypothetical protein